MKRELKKALNAALLVLAVATAAVAGETVDRTLPARSNVHVEVENIAGQVTVRAGGDDQLRVHAVLGDDVSELEISGDERGYQIEVDVENDVRRFGGRKDVESTIELWLPAGASVEVETVSAKVLVSGISGGVSAETVSGGVLLQGVSGGVEAESVSGTVTVQVAGGSVEAASVSGRVEVTGATGQVSAESVSGSVLVTMFEGSEVDLETVSGAIEFDGTIAPHGELSAETVSGQVRLALPADLTADFDIETFSGSISSDFGGTVQRASKYAPGRYLSHDGDGDIRISVETMSGGVTISRR